MGFVKYAVHHLGTAIVAFAAHQIVPKTMKLGPRQDEDARTGMYYEWIAEMDYFPRGSMSQFLFALQTLCTATKFHFIAQKQRRHSAITTTSTASLEKPASLGS